MGASDLEIANLALALIGNKAILSIDSTTDPVAVKVKAIFAFSRRKLIRSHPWPFVVTAAILGHVVDSEKTITAATKASPVVITSASHGFSNDDEIGIKEILGMVELNGRKFTVANKGTNTFELKDEDGTSHTAYISGGNAGVLSLVGSELDFRERYALPSDYLTLHHLNNEPKVFMDHRIQSNGTDKELLTNEITASIHYTFNLTDPTKFDDTFVDLFAMLLASRLAFTITNSKTLAAEVKAEYNRDLATAKFIGAQEGGTPRPVAQNDIINARRQGGVNESLRNGIRFE